MKLYDTVLNNTVNELKLLFARIFFMIADLGWIRYLNL